MALTDDDFQDLAQERDCGPKFVYHIDPVGGSDSNLGKSWQSPLLSFNQAITLATTNFANKPVSFWFNGPVNVGTGLINYQTLNLGPVKTRGFGRFASITGALPNDSTIRVGTACEYENFEIISAAGADVFNFLIGDAGTSVQDVVIRHLRMKGTTDGTYFIGATSQYTVIESIIDSQWDTFYAQNGSVGRFIRCFQNSLGPHQISGAAHLQGAGQCNGSTVYIIGGVVTFRATNSDTARVAYGIHAFNNGLVELHDTSVMCEVPNGTVVDLKTDSVSEIKVSSGSSFNLDRSLAGSTGTLTQYLSYGDVRKWNGGSLPTITPNGSSTVTLTFHDSSSNPVPNVTFTVAGQGSFYSNTSGVSSFGLPNGTYTVNANPVNGIIFPTTSLTVNGTTTLTISGAATSLTSANPSDQVAYGNIYNSDNSPATGQVINFRVSEGPSSGGVSACYLRRTMQSTTADSSGLFQFDVPKGGYVVEFWVDGGAHSSFVTSSAGSIQIGPVYGAKTP